MAFDPAYEDYQRLALAFHDPSKDNDPYRQARRAIAFSQQFSWGNDALPKSDEDRAFHLMSEAAQIIDEQLPFITESEGMILANSAQDLLEEAVALDDGCFDAHRMLHAQRSPTMEAHVRWLVENADEVGTACRDRAERAFRSSTPEGRVLSAMEMAPYLRWLMAIAQLSLLGGRYGMALDYARQCLAFDPADVADARFTGVLATAKLQDERELERFVAEVTPGLGKEGRDDAWIRLARMALAWFDGREEEAAGHIDWLLASYPHAASALTLQSELPEPMFARLAAEPFSNDELVLAVGEATVLLQEGADETGTGPLGVFLAAHPDVHAAYERELEFFGERSDGDEADDAEETF